MSVEQAVTIVVMLAIMLYACGDPPDVGGGST